MIASLVLSILVGCPKSRSSLDPALPESVTDPSAAVSTDPMEILTQSAASEDPTPRARALALLLGQDDIAQWGPVAMHDESDWVRRAAIEALGKRTDPQSRQLLEEIVADPAADPYLRGLAALRAPGKTTAASIREALSTERELWRVAPLALAAMRLGDESARPKLVRALESGELPLEVEFFQELGRTGDTSLVAALTTAQGQVEEELVLPIAGARLMLGDASGEDALRTALGEDDEERRLEALDYLVLIDHPAATALLRRASGAGPDLVTWYADLALAERTDTDNTVFEKAFAETDRELRELAVRFAALAGDSPNKRMERAAHSVVIRGLLDPDASVRVSACRAVASLGLADARDAAIQLLSDPREIVRVEASGAVLALTP